MRFLACRCAFCSAWSKDEDKRLLKLAQERNMHDWLGVARDLGTNRTALACLQRFQRALNPAFTKTKWSDDELDALRENVLRFGDRSWGDVAAHMQLRTAS